MQRFSPKPDTILRKLDKFRSTLGLALVWTGIGLAFASQFYLSSTLTGRVVDWSEALSQGLADWWVWAALSIVPLRLVRKYPIEKLGWSDHVLIHLIASILLALVYALLRALVAQAQTLYLGEAIPFADVARPLLFKTYYFNFIIYWVIVAIAQAFDYYRKYHARERSSLELEKRLSEARLQALQMQLNPHFLFNAMHNISSLMHSDVEAADSMLARLSELLRLTLKFDGAQTIPLSREIEILERYLDIERIRFGERLSVRLEIDESALSCHVPSLILQPVVENSIRHGLAPNARKGILTIHATRDDATLTLSVSDNGSGLKPSFEEGIGISNARTRLSELYGDTQSVSIANNTPPPGATTTLRLPAISQPPS